MNGLVLYRGPSMIDGSPIVVIATGLETKSTNAKTGDLIQTWILRDDISPIDAANTGADVSICGHCPHRGTIVDGKNVGRTCYVTLFQAPRNVWTSYKRGIYGKLGDVDPRKAFAGRVVRLGSYGDPAAVPFHVWKNALAEATTSDTGYTHQWRSCDPRFARYCMASCDNLADYHDAKALGWRTFRVRTASESLQKREVVCPASTEGGFKTTCELCKACGGNGAKAKVDIAIVVHGQPSKVRLFTARAA